MTERRAMKRNRSIATRLAYSCFDATAVASRVASSAWARGAVRVLSALNANARAPAYASASARVTRAPMLPHQRLDADAHLRGRPVAVSSLGPRPRSWKHFTRHTVAHRPAVFPAAGAGLHVQRQPRIGRQQPAARHEEADVAHLAERAARQR